MLYSEWFSFLRRMCTVFYFIIKYNKIIIYYLLSILPRYNIENTIIITAETMPQIIIKTTSSLELEFTLAKKDIDNILKFLEAISKLSAR